MTKLEEDMMLVIQMLEKAHGYLKLNTIENEGVSRKAIYELLRYEYIERVEYGVYRLKGHIEDELFAVQTRVSIT